jgi:undecaprenyl pyrophosphate phosphatase UppP
MSASVNQFGWIRNSPAHEGFTVEGFFTFLVYRLLLAALWLYGHELARLAKQIHCKISNQTWTGVITIILVSIPHILKERKERVTMEDNVPMRTGVAIAYALGGITVLAGAILGYRNCMSRKKISESL